MQKQTTLNVSINYFCNQKCFFCVDNNKQFLNFLKKDTDKKIYKILDNWIWKFENLVFTSWEPTLNKNFHHYIKYAKDIWYKKISLITNWSTLHIKEIRDKILNYWLNEIIVSIHWIWWLHDNIVWVKWSFKKILRWLYQLIKDNNGRIKIWVSYVLNWLNIIQYIKYIYLFESLWVNQIIINALRPEWFSWWDVYWKCFFRYNDFIELNKKLSVESINKINIMLGENKLVFTDFPMCVLYDSWFYSNLDWTVELRITYYWKNKKDEGSEVHDNNNYWKKFITECINCKLNNSCEWIYINYLNIFWKNWIKYIKK